MCIRDRGWTRRGAKVQVTDSGRPLWVIQAVEESADDPSRRQAVDEMLAEVLRERKSVVSLSRIIKDSRR